MTRYEISLGTLHEQSSGLYSNGLQPKTACTKSRLIRRNRNGFIPIIKGVVRDQQET